MKKILKSNMKRYVTGTLCVAGLISLLVLWGARNPTGHSGAAQAQELTQSVASQFHFPRRFNCNNGTLLGKYATRGDGFAPGGPPPAPMVPFATVSLMSFDGFGNLSNDVTSSLNGVISSGVNPGTYTLNDDCAGKMSITIPAPPFQLNFDLVVTDQGKEFYTIATTPSVVTVAGKRVQ